VRRLGTDRRISGVAGTRYLTMVPTTGMGAIFGWCTAQRGEEAAECSAVELSDQRSTVPYVESTWESRDLPVLAHIVEFYDEHGHSPDPAYIADACRFDDNKIVQRALRALEHEEPPFITGFDRSMPGKIIGIGAPTGHARRTVGAWPTPDALADRIIAALNEAVEAEVDPEAKSRLKRAAEAVGGVGKSVLTGVLTHVITQGM
jgi:hypothetical protein